MDRPGTVLASAGLFFIVFGFSHAETVGWAAALTIGSLALDVFLFLTYYLQVVKGYSPLPTGLLFLPSWPASWSAPMPPASSPCRGSGRVS